MTGKKAPPIEAGDILVRAVAADAEVPVGWLRQDAETIYRIADGSAPTYPDVEVYKKVVLNETAGQLAGALREAQRKLADHQLFPFGSRERAELSRDLVELGEEINGFFQSLFD